MFKNEADFKELVKRLNIDDKANPAHRENLRLQMLSAFDESTHKREPQLSFLSFGRIIMKSKITKLATAAVVILAVVIAINFWEKSVTPAYAIGQTIEAMRNVNTVHCLGTTFTGEQIELWLEVNPETGENEKFYVDSPEVTIVATPNETYMYQKKTNVVSYLKGDGHVSSDVRFGRFIEDIVDLAKSDSNAEIKIDEIGGEKPFIMLTIESDKMTLECKVDSVTKLPMSMIMKPKGGLRLGMIGQSFDEIYYNVPLPKGIFKFKIPEGAQVIEQ